MKNEELARQFGRNRKQLKTRLNEARTCLVRELRDGFGKGTFEFENQRLIGENGVVLQWKLRQRPEEPESYQNQQTTRGTVVVLRPSKEKSA